MYMKRYDAPIMHATRIEGATKTDVIVGRRGPRPHRHP